MMHQFKAKDLIEEHENIAIQRLSVTHASKEHTHEFIEMAYMWSGSAIHSINGKEYHIERGDLLFFNFKDTHAYYNQKNMCLINVYISPEFISNELVDSENAIDILTLTSFKEFGHIRDNFPPKVMFTGRDMVEIEFILEFMEKEFDEKVVGYKEVLKAYLNILLMKVFRAMKRSDTIDFYESIYSFMPQLIEFIENNYHKKITLKDLAQYSFYYPTYISRVFKECFGKSITKYVQEMRINQALRLLQETNMSIDNISLSIGYNDKKFFYKLFKKNIGMTPGQYRKKCRNEA